MASSIINGSHVKLNDGHLMPLVGLGTWQSPMEQAVTAVECALNNGYTLIDTAYSYMNEEGVGEGIRNWGGVRKDIFVVTKLPMCAMKAESVERFLKMSLAKMGLDYVDLFLIHAPIGMKYVDDKTMSTMDSDGNFKLDFGTDHIAIWKAMEAVRASGLARSIGVSNFNTAQLRRLMAVATVPPAVNQLEMHVLFQQPEMRKYCSEAGIVLTSYGTLGSPGRIGTIFAEDYTVPSLLEHPVVGVVASAHSVPPAQVLLRFFVQTGIAVIPKSVTPSRIIDNVKVLGFQLTEGEMAALRTLDRGEEGRSFNFLNIQGMQFHPECPVGSLSH